MISIENLVVSYEKNVNVIDNLNLSLSIGLIHGIVGLNGSGKTTLLNTIYGLKRQSAGNVLCNDGKLGKKDASYLATENFFYSNITAREYLNLFKAHNFDIEKWNELFRLPLDNVVDEYSTGMKKKLAILGLLKQDKPVMILDEPFNGLDIASSRIVRTLLLQLKETGKTIIITSHILETLTNLCDYIHYLRKGKIDYSCDKGGFKDFQTNLFSEIEKKNEQLITTLMHPE